MTLRQTNPIPDDQLSNAARAAASLLTPLGVVLIGGCAMAARGVSQATSDVDLLVDCDQSTLREIATRIKAAGHRIDALSEQALRDGESAELRFYHEEIQIDLIPTLHKREQDVHARATMENWCGARIRIACLVDIVVEKLRTGRKHSLDPVVASIRARLSGGERREALRYCHDLGLTTKFSMLIRDLFGD